MTAPADQRRGPVITERTLALLWESLARTIDERSPLYPDGRAQWALHDYLSGMRVITGLPIATLIQFLAEQRDPTLVRITEQLPKLKQREVLRNLIPGPDTKRPRRQSRHSRRASS